MKDREIPEADPSRLHRSEDAPPRMAYRFPLNRPRLASTTAIAHGLPHHFYRLDGAALEVRISHDDAKRLAPRDRISIAPHTVRVWRYNRSRGRQRPSSTRLFNQRCERLQPARVRGMCGHPFQRFASIAGHTPPE